MVNMRITVIQTKKRFSLPSFLFLAIFAGAAFCTSVVYTTKFVWVGAGTCLFSAIGALYSLRKQNVLLQIDEGGIFDRRTGFGKIRWHEVDDVQLHMIEGRNYLCFQLNDPDGFFARLNRAARNKFKYAQSLGFKGVNIDVTVVDVDPIDLKKEIDARVFKHGRGITGRGRLN